MKKHTNVILAVLVTAIFAATTAHAQELVYGQREYQVSYDGLTHDVPTIAYNGKDFAAFYYWSGTGGTGAGLYIRRIGNDGKPFGPQRKLLDLNLSASHVSAVWDGSAYIVYLVSLNPVEWHVVRVNVSGKVLAQHSAPTPINEVSEFEVFSLVVDERTFLFFSTYKGLAEHTPYMLSVDRKLKKKPVLEKLPTSYTYAKVLGATLDPDKFLIFLGNFTSPGLGREIKEAELLHLDFEGKLKKTVRPTTFQPESTGPAKQVQTTDLREAAGPVYTGDGYILAGVRRYPIPIPGTSYPHINSSLKIDDTGQIIDGPFDLGGGETRYWLGKPLLFGQHVSLPIQNTASRVVQMSLLGPRGKHITNVDVNEASAGAFQPESADAIYTGSSSTTVYKTYKDPNTNALGSSIFSNIITNPASAKPKVVYFQASSGKPFGDTRKLVMWSVSAGTKVSLSGPKLKLKNVPPVFHTVIDTKGKKTKLRLRYTGTDGKTRKSKLVLKP